MTAVSLPACNTCGRKPVVASDTNGILWVQDPQCGIFIQGGRRWAMREWDKHAEAAP